MTLTGGYFVESLGKDIPLNGSGSFTYDLTSGFSDFIINIAGGVFDLTASANGAAGCAPNSNCAPGDDAADNFNDLMHDAHWSMISFNPPSPAGETAILFTQNTNGIFGEVPGMLVPMLTPNIGGSFTLAMAPEPGTLLLLSVAALALLFRSRKYLPSKYEVSRRVNKLTSSVR